MELSKSYPKKQQLLGAYQLEVREQDEQIHSVDQKKSAQCHFVATEVINSSMQDSSLLDTLI